MDAEVGLAQPESLAPIERSERRLQCPIAIEAGRSQDGTHELRADGHGHHVGAHNGGRAARRTARRAQRIERVGGWTGIEKAQRCGDGLSQDDRARIAQRTHNGAVILRKVAVKGSAAHLRGHVASFNQILDADRHAVDSRERTAVAVPPGAGVGRGARACRVHYHPALELAFALGNHVQAAFEIFPRTVAAINKVGAGIMKGQRGMGVGIVGHVVSPDRLIHCS